MRVIGASALRRYGAASFAVFLAFGVRMAVTPLVGHERFPFAAFLLAIVFCALYCGVGPSTLSVGLSLAIAWFVFLPVHFSFTLTDPGPQLQQVTVFLVLSISFIIVGESNRRTRVHLKARVEDRTRELSDANEGMRELSARLMQIQDDERRRIARELHDGVGQSLAAISMNNSMVENERESLTSLARQCAKENVALIQDVITEIRTMSHLLHPPLLDEIGLRCALQGYVDGFVERSSISVALELPQDLERLSLEEELSLFRVAQECLTNIHRHSNSVSAMIRIRRIPGQVAMEVSDAGRGIDRELQQKLLTGQGPGVGLRGMRERIRRIGGLLEIESGNNGTLVRVTVPVSAPTNRADGAGQRLAI